MLRVTQDRKSKYVSLGVSVHPNFWDFKKNQPKINCPNRIAIQRLITEKTKEYTDQLIDLRIEKKEFTATTLIEKVDKPTKRMNVNDLFLQQIELLRKEERIRYAESNYYVYTSLLKFNKHLDIYFSDINVQWLKKYET